GREWLLKVGDLYEFLSNRNLHADEDVGDEESERPESKRVCEVHPGRLTKLSAVPPPSRPPLHLALRAEHSVIVAGAAEELTDLNSREKAFQLMTLVIHQAELTLRWRRSLITLEAAERSGGDREWISACEREVSETQATL